MMQRDRLALVCGVAAILAGLGWQPRAEAAVIPVAAGATAENLGDGTCSLIEAINEANITGAAGGDCAAGSAGTGAEGLDSITLEPGSIYSLSAVYGDDADGPNGLPPIQSSIIIEGNSATLVRSFADGTPAFRFFLVTTDGRLTLRDQLLVHGDAGDGGNVGGAIYVKGPTPELTIEGSEISANSAKAGGAIYFSNLGGAGQLTISNSQFNANTAAEGEGGALYLNANETAVVIEDARFQNNSCLANGGAISAGGITSLHIDRATFQDNSAANVGGALSLSQVDSATIVRTTLQGNTAFAGGALYLVSIPITIANSTLTKNAASFWGGAVTANGDTEVTLVHSTVAANTAVQFAGGYVGTVIKVQNSIVSGNTADGSAPNCYTQTTSLGHNIIGDTSGGCSEGWVESDLINVDPQLGALTDDFTTPGAGHFPLSAASPAIDTADTTACVVQPDGTDLTSDQLGQARYGPCDIGAVEFGACGDGILQLSVESCDDGNTTDGDGCSSLCKGESCGDGIVQLGEACDDGNGDNNDACLNACVAAACGDNVTQTDVEECDLGFLNSDTSSACTAQCKTAVCGDGLTYETFESCDDANQVNDDSCNNQCVNAFCGDGIVQAVEGETCEDGNNQNDDGCSNACLLPVCGNDVVEFGEVCDDGNLINTDGCLATCQAAQCGDGAVQAGVEACDDGNLLNGDGCQKDCARLEVCGDGVPDPQEACDDGNALDGDGCAANCIVETVPEPVDDGDDEGGDGDSDEGDGGSDGDDATPTDTADDSTPDDTGDSDVTPPTDDAEPATTGAASAEDAAEVAPVAASETAASEDGTSEAAGTADAPTTPVVASDVPSPETGGTTDTAAAAEADTGGGCSLILP
ncbi:MAG: DUF4215 domain-containing protein [Deltaproteobacteria bacterium]|nr:DUF4215 domain-containing protein [Deltaproteobacteria bacterium]